jgi:hypothetical protein
MSIIPENITTVRVDQLPNEPATLSSLLAHQVGTELKQTSVSDFISLVANAIESGSGVGFLPVTVSDGQTLPPIPENPSFILVGAGTYGNLDGFPDLVCTENLNALITVGTHWEISVEIPINPLTGSVQSVTGSAVDNTDPLNPVINLTGGSTSTPNFQEVTDAGASTTNDVKYKLSENTYIIIKSSTQEIEFYEEVSGSPVLRSKMNKSSFNVYRNGGGSTLMDGNSVYIEDATAENSIGLFLDSPTGITALSLASSTLGETTYFIDRIGVNGIEYDLPTGDGARISKVPIVISSNTTASNDTNYSVVANATFTDPTPVEGKGYMVTVINGTATIGGVGYTVGQKVFRHYHSGSWRSFVYLDKSIIDTLLANKIDYLIRDFTFSSVTGVTTETLVESYEITAGKIGLNDFLNGFIYTTRTGLSNAYTVTLKANTVNNSSTATTIASLLTIGNFAPILPMKFELTVKAGVIIGTTIEQTQGTNYRGQSVAINVPFNNSSNSVYLFLFVTPTNTLSVVQVESFKLTK